MMTDKLVFFWDNFGPTHVDRVAAVVRAARGRFEVSGIELRDASVAYDWQPPATGFDKVSLFGVTSQPGTFRRLRRLIAACNRIGRGHYFLCHYDWPDVFLAACYLRLTGSRVYTMLDSKFDDKPRRLWFEVRKSLALAPYQGALAGSPRTEAYLRFLGMRNKPIAGGYDTISIERIQRLAGVAPAPDGLAHAERDFICVARLVPKKNHTTLLAAFARHRALARSPRQLHLCGNGPEKAALMALADELGIAGQVNFHGFVQTEGVSQMLGRGLALILPSTEEQFGQVVPEAQAMGLPVIVSDKVGARDVHVRSGVEGFVVEPGNIEGIAHFMTMLSDDAALWRRMAEAAHAASPAGDAAQFVASVESLVGQSSGRRHPKLTATRDRSSSTNV